jgi:hypothetical protein
MTAIAERAQEIGTASSPAAAVPPGWIKERLAEMWLMTMVVLGLVLSVIWTGGLLWLLLLAVI